MSIRLTNSQARQVILHLQALSAPPTGRMKAGDLARLIEQLGYVQVDSIQWVERAHHMILFARNQTYRPAHLAQLHEKEQQVFENWTHDACYIPSEFYPIWRHKFQRDAPRLKQKFENWQGPGFLQKCDALVERIAKDGPLMSRDVERAKGVKQQMWQWHDGKAALEYLWRTGVLGIRARQGFQKVYDLCSNTVPSHHYHGEVSHQEFVDWCCRAALERLGFGSAGDIARFFDLVTIKEANEWIASQGNNSLVPVDIETADRRSTKQLVARPDIVSLVAQLPNMPKRIRALSPFDPVIRDRKRLQWLFGFDYRIEIYVPAEKRRWGYYVFPLLQGDRIIGRIDMRAHRASDSLDVAKVWLEPGVKAGSQRMAALNGELERQAKFTGMNEVVWAPDALQPD